MGVAYRVTYTYLSDPYPTTQTRTADFWGSIGGVRGEDPIIGVQDMFINCYGRTYYPRLSTPAWIFLDNVGNNYKDPANPKIISITRVDEQPDIGGNLPPSSSFNWKDWPQDKRQAATSLLTDDDLLPILKLGNTGILATGQSFPNGIHFFPSDGQPATFLPGPITVSDHLSQPTPSPSPEPSPIPSPIPLPSPSPESTPPPPPPLPEPEPETDGAGAMEGGGYTNDRGSSLYSQLVNELRSRGINFTEANIVFIGKDQTGKVIWLETGTKQSGLTHILSKEKIHSFKEIGISKDKIAEVVMAAVTRGKIVGIQGKRPVYQVIFNGKTHYIAVDVGNNGYIVGANPKSPQYLKKKK